jgi:hypothetical protein
LSFARAARVCRARDMLRMSTKKLCAAPCSPLPTSPNLVFASLLLT